MPCCPTHTDVVGSLIRPDYLLSAKMKMREGKMDPGKLREIEDRAVLEAIDQQQQAGIEIITDGEYRRNSWVAFIPLREDPIYEAVVNGFEFLEADALWWSLWKSPSGQALDGKTLRQEFNITRDPFITGKMSLNRDIVRAEYPFLKAHAEARTKFNLPSPSWHRIFWHPEYSSRAYPTADDFIAAIVEFYREHIIKPLLSLGCDYIQLDAPNYAQWHIDPSCRQAFEEQGHDMAHELIADAEFDNQVFAGISGITTGIHLCRGNAPRGRFFASGGYEAIAETVFPRWSNINTLLLEFDSPRAGGFAPLAHTLEQQQVILGLVTTKDPRLEGEDLLVTRIHEAADFVPLERLGLSPQCGFASGEVADTMSMGEQQAKLELVGRTARRVWG